MIAHGRVAFTSLVVYCYYFMKTARLYSLSLKKKIGPLIACTWYVSFGYLRVLLL